MSGLRGFHACLHKRLTGSAARAATGRSPARRVRAIRERLYMSIVR